jgi:hypothetical protein
MKGATMDQKSLEDVMMEASGNPSCGVVREAIPLLAAAVVKALNPKSDTEQRIIKPVETR